MTQKINIRRNLTPEEVHELDQKVREMTTQIADHKDTIDFSKNRIKALTEAAEEIARKSKAGVTHEDIDAIIYYDFEENNKYFCHPLTGEVVRVIRIPKHELQADIFAAGRDGKHISPDQSMIDFLRASGIEPEAPATNAPDERDIAAARAAQGSSEEVDGSEANAAGDEGLNGKKGDDDINPDPEIQDQA